MNVIQKMVQHNQQFVDNKQYTYFITDKYPDKKIAILACMDTRLSVLLPAALGLANGEAKIIKNAGAVVSQPYGSAMHSLMVAIYDLGVEDILVVGHDDCGAESLNADAMIKKMKERGISQEVLDTLYWSGIRLNTWLEPISDVEESVRETVEKIRCHPLVPKDVRVHGMVMSPDTGAIRVIDEDHSLEKEAPEGY